jgi:hypothetical protein
MWKVKYIPDTNEHHKIALVKLFKSEEEATKFAKSLGKRLISITSIT